MLLYIGVESTSNVLFVLGAHELDSIIHRCIFILCLVESPVLFSRSFFIINLIYISVDAPTSNTGEAEVDGSMKTYKTF